jgi:hypothetical protein
MKKSNLIADSPYGHLIVADGNIKLRSVFDFPGCTELFSFLYVCEQVNCTVEFENEEIIVEPKNTDNAIQTMLAVYVSFGQDDTIFKRYMNYLTKLGADGKREPTVCDK